jgi:hypothetical protein
MFFTPASAGGTGLAGNPPLAGTDRGSNGRDDNSGYYARWTVFLSGKDVVNGERQASVVLNCKYVSANAAGTLEVAAPAGGDDDGDCLQDSSNAEPGRSGFLDTNDANADQDGDGLVDGVEVAWGSCPNTSFVFSVAAHGFSFNCSTVSNAKDTDGDGRSDLEEILGDSTQVSNPRAADTDGDGANDGGIAWDADDDGTPDTTLAAGSTQPLAGGAVSPAKTNKAFVVSGTAIAPYEGDNCSNIANGAQTNSDSAAINAEDRTNADEDEYGDACDADNDNDEFTDGAEAGNLWYASGGGLGDCSTTGGAGFVAAAAATGTRDSDGDRRLDGAECRDEKNPASSTSRAALDACTTSTGGSDPPYIESCGSDADGTGLQLERDMGTESIPQSTSTLPSCTSGFLCNIDGGRLATDATFAGDSNNGTIDADSDADGIKESWEIQVWGTSPANQDTDADGCPDGVEIVSVGGPSDAGQRQVEYTDFFELLDHYGTTTSSGGWSTGGVFVDYDASGDVGFGDLVAQLLLWNKRCEPSAVLESGSDSPPPSSGANVHINPDPATAAVPTTGNTFTIDLSGAPVSGLAGFSVIATYNPAIIDVTTVANSSAIPGAFCAAQLPDTGGGAASGALEITWVRRPGAAFRPRSPP